MASLSVERRQARDEADLFGLYGEVFGEEMTEASRRRWRWQYLENPHTSPEGPEIWVAREGDQLLGQYASMPVRLRWGGQEVRASWGMDVFVRAEARGKGVGARLFTTWSDNVDVALGLGLTPSSYGLFKKLRYEDVGPVPFYRRVLDPHAVLTRRAGPVLGSLAAPFLALGLKALQRERALAPDVVVQPITGFSDEYDRLWDSARASYAMCVRRDRSYLDWKYVRCPNRTYALWEARRGAALVGYAVSRNEDYHGLRLGWILDVFADAGDHAAKQALIAAVLTAFAKAGVARAQAFCLNAALAEDLLARGFRSGRSPMQFCVRARVASDGVVAALARWHVVFGDSDMDR
jgi:GNAT superfamily N-acetyltransferase